MRRLLVYGSVAIIAAALVALLVYGVLSQGTNTSLDAAVAKGRRPVAPDAAQPLPQLGAAGTTTLASLRGKVVVLNVFASWCEPCKAEAPILDQAQRVLAAHGGTVLGVTYLDNSSASEDFVRRQRIAYPVVRDVSGSFVRAFGTTGVPETFVIDRRGRVAALRRFQLDSRWVDRTLPKVLAEQPS